MDKILLAEISLAVVNGIAFFVMYLDKVRSRKQGAERIPEGLMFFSAAVFGGIGVFGGMLFFRHKTAKWYFMLGIPLFILQNIATVLFASYYLK